MNFWFLTISILIVEFEDKKLGNTRLREPL